MGEVLLRQALKGYPVQVDSAGIHGQHGLPADETVSRLLHENRMSEIDQHKSKPLVSGMAGRYDLYLCMEEHHLDDLQKIIPSVTGRAYLFGHWSDQEIQDPHQMSEDLYRIAYNQIDQAAKAWLENLPRLGLL